MAIYRVDGRSGRIDMVCDELRVPNGICFSPDYRQLYATDSGAPTEIRAFDVVAEYAGFFLAVVAAAAAGLAAAGARCSAAAFLCAAVVVVGAGLTISECALSLDAANAGCR